MEKDLTDNSYTKHSLEVGGARPHRRSPLKQPHPDLESSVVRKYRKGHLPHIVAVTAEPLPTRIATLALGTGDIDCVYHFALPELEEAIKDVDNQDQLDILSSMVEGKRLRDISDLPFDLAV
jgi:hypothetical protein